MSAVVLLRVQHVSLALLPHRQLPVRPLRLRNRIGQVGAEDGLALAEGSIDASRGTFDLADGFLFLALELHAEDFALVVEVIGGLALLVSDIAALCLEGIGLLGLLLSDLLSNPGIMFGEILDIDLGKDNGLLFGLVVEHLGVFLDSRAGNGVLGLRDLLFPLSHILLSLLLLPFHGRLWLETAFDLHVRHQRSIPVDPRSLPIGVVFFGPLQDPRLRVRLVLK